MRLSIGLLAVVCLTKGVHAQKAFTWQEIRDKFEARNPTLRAGQAERILPLEEFRNIAMDARPDLKAAAQAVDKAQTDHKLAVADGSTDPIGSYMTAASQLNLAVGREVIQ